MKMRLFAGTATLCALAVTSIGYLRAEDKAEGKPAAAAEMKAPLQGEYWYAVHDTNAKQDKGYARLRVMETKGGTITLKWEAGINFERGDFEETRTVDYGADGRQQSFESAWGDDKVSATRTGNTWTYKADDEEMEVEAPQNAVAGMTIALAAWLPLKEGTVKEFNMRDERAGLADLGALTFTVGKKEKTVLHGGESVEAWKIARVGGGKDQSIWVSDDRRMVKADLGVGMILALSKTPTKELFKKEPPFFEDHSGDDKANIKLHAHIYKIGSGDLWKLLTTQEGLSQWWAPKAEIEHKVGGKYHLTWPGEDESDPPVFQLLGEITGYEKDHKLTYTWRWSTDAADAKVPSVTYELREFKGGTDLTITHGPYGLDEEGQAERKAVLDTWQFFGGPLRRAIDKAIAEKPRKKAADGEQQEQDQQEQVPAKPPAEK